MGRVRRHEAEEGDAVACRDSSGYHEAGQNAFGSMATRWLPGERERLVEEMKADAAKVLVPGTRFEIRESIGHIPPGVAWYWTRTMARGNDAQWFAEQPGEKNGYILVERCKTP
jgi:hypothetical protein